MSIALLKLFKIQTSEGNILWIPGNKARINAAFVQGLGKFYGIHHNAMNFFFLQEFILYPSNDETVSFALWRICTARTNYVQKSEIIQGTEQLTEGRKVVRFPLEQVKNGQFAFGSRNFALLQYLFYLEEISQCLTGGMNDFLNRMQIELVVRLKI